MAPADTEHAAVTVGSLRQNWFMAFVLGKEGNTALSLHILDFFFFQLVDS